jgi:hypothetical protein
MTNTPLLANDRLVLLSPPAGTTSLDFDFQILDEADMLVERVRDGIRTALTPGIDFTFPAGTGTIDGGSLQLAVASLADDAYVLAGAEAIERVSDFLQAQRFSTDKINADLDKLTRVSQEARRDIGRAWKAAFGQQGGRIDALPEGHFHLADGDGNLVDGGSGVDIASAQENAAIATEQAGVATAAADTALGAMTTVIDPQFTTFAAAQLYSPAVAPDFIRTSGYAEPADGGGAVYRKVAVEPAHAAKFPITLDDGVTQIWYELGNRGRIDIAAMGASAALTKAANRQILIDGLQALDVTTVRVGELIIPPGADHGRVITDPSTFPHRLAEDLDLPHDVIIYDWSPGATYEGTSGRDGAQVFVSLYTRQTVPFGQHDGNGVRQSADWHPYYMMDNSRAYAAPGDPSRSAGDNHRASYFTALQGEAIWQIFQGLGEGADLTNEELLSFGILSYPSSFGGGNWYPLVCSYKNGNQGFGIGTSQPTASFYFLQPSAGFDEMIVEGRESETSITLRNNTGGLVNPADDVKLRNISGDFGLFIEGQGNAITVNKLNRVVGFATYVVIPSRATTERADPAGLGVGAMMFDTTLGKPIWSNGTNWVDAAGALV